MLAVDELISTPQRTAEWLRVTERMRHGKLHCESETSWGGVGVPAAWSDIKCCLLGGLDRASLPASVNHWAHG
jgi:hypothetical protein